MDPTVTSGAGLLLPAELDSLADMVRSGQSPNEVDDQSRAFLLVRGAITDWELKSRQGGERDFFLGSHRLFDAIARGRTHEVCFGQHLYTGRIEVVKIVRRDKDNQELLRRHIRKIRIHSLAECSRFVALRGAGFTRGVDFAVTECARGDHLRTFVRQNGALPIKIASAIGLEVAAALASVHGLGAVYGNLQPRKIVLEGDGGVRLYDAGLGEPEGKIPFLSRAPGTAVDCMSPEAIMGEDITAASDVYSLGCVLYYGTTGKVPFPGGTEATKRQGHVAQFPLDPRKLVEQLDDRFVDLIAAMMAKKPEKRIQSVGEVLERLEPWTKKG
jgi:serine/threonine-protein kinase